MVSDIEALRYNEALQLPRFKASLDKLLNKKSYDLILTYHSMAKEDLPQFIDKALSEGNAILIERENCGYTVMLWKD